LCAAELLGKETFTRAAEIMKTAAVLIPLFISVEIVTLWRTQTRINHICKEFSHDFKRLRQISNKKSKHVNMLEPYFAPSGVIPVVKTRLSLYIVQPCWEQA
jgi:hypothetical protein